MNGMWGYKVKDQNYKSVKDLVRLLVRTAGKGANLLINIGPQPNGELPELALNRLKGMGEWLRKYGETIYDTTAGNVMSAEWGTTTRKGDKLYVHILSDKMPQFITLPINRKVKSATEFESGKAITKEKIKGGIVLHTGNLSPDTDRIITLTLN